MLNPKILPSPSNSRQSDIRFSNKDFMILYYKEMRSDILSKFSMLNFHCLEHYWFYLLEKLFNHFLFEYMWTNTWQNYRVYHTPLWMLLNAIKFNINFGWMNKLTGPWGICFELLLSGRHRPVLLWVWVRTLIKTECSLKAGMVITWAQARQGTMPRKSNLCHNSFFPLMKFIIFPAIQANFVYRNRAINSLGL